MRTPAKHTMFHAIGNTPLLQLQQVVPRESAAVYVKLEAFNPTGSYKDRMALAMIEEAERRGELQPGMTVVEYTGGSTGSSLAFVCAIKGYRFRVVSSDAFSAEKLRTMKAFGAELEIVPSPSGQITPDLIPRMVERARELAAQPGVYFTNQFHNRDMLSGYAAIGHEIKEQIPGPVHAFCAAVGTAGLAMGVASVLMQQEPRPRIVLLEPATSAVISTGTAGAHHVEGIGVGFVPPLLDPQRYDEVRAIDEMDARAMAQRLAREEGLLAGTSSALNIVAALQLAEELGSGRTVVTVACDSGLKYLAGDLYRETTDTTSGDARD